MLRFSAEGRPHLSGVLWLTPLDALSPGHRLPIPRANNAEETQVYPSTTRLRVVTVAALLSNWLNWFSRLEVYASLGKSRVSSELLSDSVAAHILQPYSLGCGQAPIFDVWPLWLARSLVSRILPHLLSWPLPPSKNCILIPFSDLDEI